MTVLDVISRAMGEIELMEWRKDTTTGRNDAFPVCICNCANVPEDFYNRSVVTICPSMGLDGARITIIMSAE